ncbi:MAG: hypothetical protein KJ629_00705, partial [Candidatus Omnitrophica bacterium]|nr:hypothetical protein [Candidatus Omnitrophota bacterium]
QKPRLLSEKSIQMAKLYFLRGWSIKQISFIGRITDCVTRHNVQRVLRRLKEISPLSIGEFLDECQYSHQKIKKKIENDTALKKEFTKLLNQIPILDSYSERARGALKFYFGLADREVHTIDATVAAHRITCGKLHSCINEIKQSELSTDLEEALEEYTSRGVKKEGQPSKNYFTESQLNELEELIDKKTRGQTSKLEGSSPINSTAYNIDAANFQIRGLTPNMQVREGTTVTIQLPIEPVSSPILTGLRIKHAGLRIKDSGFNGLNP